MSKTPDDYFSNWEGHVFGFGYGSGEDYIIPALKRFLEGCPDEGAYDYRDLEAALSPTVAWLLINTLCHADILEYGTSPRHGWLTATGVALRKFVSGHTHDQLVDLAQRDEDYTPCYPDCCNCRPLYLCANPFWDKDAADAYVRDQS